MLLETRFFETDSSSERTRAFKRTRAAVNSNETSTPPLALETHTKSTFRLSRAASERLRGRS